MNNELLKECASKGFLLDKDILRLLESEEEKVKKEFVNLLCLLKISSKIISIKILQKNEALIISHLKKIENKDLERFLENLGFSIGGKSLREESTENQIPLKLISAPAFLQRKIVLNDFVNHFRSRYELLRKKLEKNQIEDLTTIRKIKGAKGTFTIIVMVSGKRTTKNKNVILEVEDLTGSINVLINQNKKEIYEMAKEIVPDEVLALNVSNNGRFLYCNNLLRPSVTLQEKKRSKDDIWLAFISDIHVGSTFFLEEPFLRFIKWMNGVGENEEYKKIAKKVKYLFIAGDLIDGVSHYPGQEKYLTIQTSKGQYQKLYEYLSLLRKDLKIVACSGDHDTVWVGEPQPAISERWAEPFYKMENFMFVPSPSILEISGGLKVMLYHGRSMVHFMNELPKLRLKYGLTSAAVYIEEMLKRGHLSPMHGAVDYIPCDTDPMVITKVPDIILTGDIHRSGVSMHSKIIAMAGSCWQSNTPFTEKVGQVPDPCKVVLFNLKTREVKILDFSDEEGQKEEMIKDG